MKYYRGYSVFIAGRKGKNGTGLLLYIGGDCFFIITCSHVIFDSDEVQISLLHDDGTGSPVEKKFSLHNDHFHFMNASLQPSIEEDLAIIECPVRYLDFDLSPTRYRFYPMNEDEAAIAYGYPVGRGEKNLYYRQDKTKGEVLNVLEEESYFVLRIEDKFLNQADRTVELEGFSGSPVWESENLKADKCLMGGIISSGMDGDAHRARVRVISSRVIQTFLRERFDIHLESVLPFISEDEIAPGYKNAEKQITDIKIVRDSWIERSKTQIRAYIDDLKLGKAIEVYRKTIKNVFFAQCSMEQKYSIYADYIQALRYARKYSDCEKAYEEMKQGGIHSDREYLVKAVQYFEAGNGALAKEYINKALDKNPIGNEECVLKVVIDAFENNKTTSDCLSTFIGEQDQLLIKPKNVHEEETLYQILGVTLISRFNNFKRGIRCLNRSYIISGSYVVLESIANAYCDQALITASQHDLNTHNFSTNEYMSKARDAYMRIIAASDEINLSGLFSRSGILIYRCFIFSDDRYRVYRHYNDVMKYVQSLNKDIKREFQFEYVRAAILKEQVDLDKFDSLTDFDKKYFELIQFIDNPEVAYQTEKELVVYIRKIEQLLKIVCEHIKDFRLSLDGVYRKLIILYIEGCENYKWYVLPIMWDYCDKITEPENRIYCSLMIKDCEGQGVRNQYEELYSEHDDYRSFEELIKYYEKHGYYDDAKRLFDRHVLNTEHPYGTETDLLYREYLRFYLRFGMNLKNVICHYVKNKNRIKDDYISLYFDLYLSNATGVFNNTELLQEDAKILFEAGVINEFEYKDMCLASTMYNLRIEDSAQWVDFSHENSPQSTPHERRYFVLKKYWVRENPYWNRLDKWTPEKLFELYSKEEWAKTATEIFDRFKTKERKVIVADFWAIYYLAALRRQQIMANFDKVYITHFSVERAMQEMENTNDIVVRLILNNLGNESNVEFRSPTLEEQATQYRDMDEELTYTETISTLMLSEVMNCPAIIGEVRNEIPDRYKNRLIRPYRFPEIADYMIRNG